MIRMKAVYPTQEDYFEVMRHFMPSEIAKIYNVRYDRKRDLYTLVFDLKSTVENGV